MSEELKRLQCPGVGKPWLHGAYYTFKTYLPKQITADCCCCHKRERATLTGQRGRWYYAFDLHRGEGVTKTAWNAAQRSRQGLGR